MEKNLTINSSLPIDFVLFEHLTSIAHWIYRLWTISFVTFGLIGNLLALIVFMKWIQKLSVYVYFSVLCVVNICILINDLLFNNFLPYVLDRYHLEEIFLPVLCRFNFFMIYFFRYLFIWLLTCINIDRCLFLVNISYAKTILCRSSSAWLICIVLILLSAAINIHFLVFCTKPLIYSYTCHLDGNLCQCDTNNLAYQQFWRYGWPAIHLFVFGILPLMIMCLCLIRIVQYVRTVGQPADKIRRNSTSSIISQHTLIGLDLLFPLTVFPMLFLQTFIYYVPPQSCRAIGIWNVFFAISSAATFIKNTFAFCIYYLSGKKFRLAVKDLFQSIPSRTFSCSSITATTTSNSRF